MQHSFRSCAAAGEPLRRRGLLFVSEHCPTASRGTAAQMRRCHVGNGQACAEGRLDGVRVGVSSLPCARKV